MASEKRATCLHIVWLYIFTGFRANCWMGCDHAPYTVTTTKAPGKDKKFHHKFQNLSFILYRSTLEFYMSWFIYIIGYYA